MPLRWRVRPETLRAMRAGFRNGDVAALITRDCRTDANDEYDDDDAREMLDRTRPPLRHTLNLPFCFAPGAHALRNSLLRMAYDAPELPEDRAVDEPRGEPRTGALHTDLHAIRRSRCSQSASRLRFANDIDVGVYASPKGGVEASWHYDANHNVTVQLYGSKTWFVTRNDAAPKSGAGNVNVGRGLVDAPRNARVKRETCSTPRAFRNSSSIRGTPSTCRRERGTEWCRDRRSGFLLHRNARRRAERGRTTKTAACLRRCA